MRRAEGYHTRRLPRPGSLEWRPGTPRKGIRLLRVETTRSSSWVAWREIEVYAAAD
jgi:hypothetical protein